MKTSFLPQDVTLLLKDITGLVKPLPTAEREKLIQSGVHYSQMLPLEYTPSKEYIQEYENALESFGAESARAVGIVSEKIYKLKGTNTVIVSLARAGTPIGILICRYLRKKYKIKCPHYTISIIRGKGIDHNAMKYITRSHKAQDLQFVDGWTGKGAILRELEKEISLFPGVDPTLAVLADPANITDLCGTHDDFLIANSCLNSTVSGLMSRTFLRDDIIGENDFHGVHVYSELSDQDRTYEFIESVEKHFVFDYKEKNNLNSANSLTGLEESKKIAQEFGIPDINFIKPGIGETTRVLLRRVPYAVLIKKDAPIKYIGHIIKLAEEKNVKIIDYPLKRYRACGIIQSIGADL